MLGTTEKPAVRSDPRLEPTVQGPKPATASRGTNSKSPSPAWRAFSLP